MISVLVAVKANPDANKFLPSAVETVRAQSYSDWEMLIGVNGADSEAVIDRVPSDIIDDRKITVYSLPEMTNQGSAMNYLLGMANGDLIASLDVDDLWHPLKLQKQIPFINKYTIVGTQGRYFGRHKHEIGTPAGPIPAKHFLRENPILHSSVLMKKCNARWIETNDFMVPIDYARWLELASEGATFFNVQEILTFIHLHDSRWSDNRPNNDRVVDNLRNSYVGKIQ